MTALVDNASAEGRRLTDDEQQQYLAFEAELAAANGDEAIRGRHNAYNTVVVPAGVPSPTQREPETLDKAFRSYLRSAQPNDDISELRINDPADIGGPRPTNAQGTEQGPAGGYLVPEGFRTKIVERLKAVGGLANAAETITTETGNTLPWPTVDDTANAGEIVDEGAGGTTGADVAFGVQDLSAWEYQAGGVSGEPLLVPWALMQDSAFDIEALLARLLGTRLGRALAPHLISGDGVKKPKGILHGVTGQEFSSSPSYDDLVDLTTAVDYLYWPGSKWLLSQLGLGRVWKIKDSHGDPIWRRGQTDRLEDGTLMGYPIQLDNGMPDFVGTNGAGTNWIVFGDLAAGYVVRRVRDVALVVNPWSSAKKRQNEYTAWMRVDGRPQDTNAYKVGAGFTA